MKVSAIFGSILLLCSIRAGAETVTLECERFADCGGWTLDAQFMDEMGSPYLLAHGLGIPVADAVTSFDVQKGGRFSVWVRTKNWTAPWSAAPGAGAFKLFVNGAELPERLGVQGKGEWLWAKAGDVTLKTGANTVALRDLTGFDGRVDAVCLTTDEKPSRPPVSHKARLVEADLTVVGGGIAGICTAISAARLGLKVALVQDRPVLGGANSSEVRVHLGGRQNLGAYPRLGDVVSEIGPAHGGNARDAANYEDNRKLAAVRAEKNIALFLNTHVNAVSVDGAPGRRTRGAAGRLTGVSATDVVTGAETVFRSPLYADCTGDGTVGFLAGADYRLGRESKAETGESRAVEKADARTMGASVQWNAEKRAPGAPGTTFPSAPWMLAFDEKSGRYDFRGDWDWETGMDRDQLGAFETVRDYGLLVAYSNWNFVKNTGAKRAEWKDAALAWVAYVAGKRETRRLLGDHILCEQDVLEERPYADGTCCTTWSIDLHDPMTSDESGFAGEPFRSVAVHTVHRAYPIPYGCFYSRNVPNLFMAGRDISVTHVALGTTRVMRTHGMQGEVVGMAASVCRARACDPRAVRVKFLDDLKALMARGVGLGKRQPPQNYNLGAMHE